MIIRDVLIFVTTGQYCTVVCLPNNMLQITSSIPVFRFLVLPPSITFTNPCNQGLTFHRTEFRTIKYCQ